MSAAAAQARPVDLAHLARYTGGDAALDAEVLQLFSNQSTTLLAQLDAALETANQKSWREVTHSIKGAARGIGAFALADAAASAEPADLAGDPATARTALQALKDQAGIVQGFIKTYLDS